MNEMFKSFRTIREEMRKKIERNWAEKLEKISPNGFCTMENYSIIKKDKNDELSWFDEETVLLYEKMNIKERENNLLDSLESLKTIIGNKSNDSDKMGLCRIGIKIGELSEDILNYLTTKNSVNPD